MVTDMKRDAEKRRMHEARERRAHWYRWGPYLSERQWGTVREDYSAGGTAWSYLPHDHARSRAYRWGEDGIAGISDNHQRLCLAFAFWNGNDPILKERLFGLGGPEGNHGEDVKEYYWYLDNVPSHAYMRMLYKYPQRAFPYTELVEVNRRRNRADAEFELLDTGIFEEERYFDIEIEYAKRTPDDILARVTVVNRGPERASLTLLPTLWFRNTWSWASGLPKPLLSRETGIDEARVAVVRAEHLLLGQRWLSCEGPTELLFTENETNFERLYGTQNASPWVKDGIDAYVVHGRTDAVNGAARGTKVAARYVLDLEPGQQRSILLRLGIDSNNQDPFRDAADLFALRRAEADAFYHDLQPKSLGDDRRSIQRQALAGMLWSKQFYHFIVRDWLSGDPATPPPPRRPEDARNHGWEHVYNDDILSMPDAWEYPWFAAWDLAFHCISLALVDPQFAKQQLMLLTREWYMHPNGQLPAYEWAFDDVNPPVHAWAAYRVYKIDEKMNGSADVAFLERVFQKLLLNFTWWVNRKDSAGNNVFQGGFLGLDNIGVFDRSAPLPTGGHIDQSDGTSWMGVYALNMLAIALELAKHNAAYEDIASKFFEHFLRIADAMNRIATSEGAERLWDDEDGFYYDFLHLPNGGSQALRVRSIVGLIPLLAAETIGPETLKALPNFARRLSWFVENRPDLRANVANMDPDGVGERRLLAIVTRERLERLLGVMLDEREFLSDHGIRALSKFHAEHPYRFALNGNEYRVDYEPAESRSGLFGGNSNWRGPVWFPINYLLIEALQKFHHYYGDELRFECPTGSGNMANLWEISMELSNRLIRIFEKDQSGRRPVFGGAQRFQTDPLWHDHLLFYEYFHGDNGAGIGASHQTGWTGLVAKLIQQVAEHGHEPSRQT